MNKNLRILRLIIVLEVFLLIVLAVMAVVKGCSMPDNDYLTPKENNNSLSDGYNKNENPVIRTCDGSYIII